MRPLAEKLEAAQKRTDPLARTRGPPEIRLPLPPWRESLADRPPQRDESGSPDGLLVHAVSVTQISPVLWRLLCGIFDFPFREPVPRSPGGLSERTVFETELMADRRHIPRLNKRF